MKIMCSNCESENEISSKYCSACGFKLSSSESDLKNGEAEAEKPITIKRKLDIKTSIGFVIGFLAIFYLTQYFFKPSLDIDKEIVNSVNEINKICPLRVDEYLVLDNALALPNKTIQYNYTLVDLEKSEVNLDTVKKYVFSGVLTNVKTNPDMKAQRDNNLIFNYYYRDKNGEFVTKYIVTPDMYK